jgi:hypothetical protein
MFNYVCDCEPPLIFTMAKEEQVPDIEVNRMHVS